MRFTLFRTSSLTLYIITHLFLFDIIIILELNVIFLEIEYIILIIILLFLLPWLLYYYYGCSCYICWYVYPRAVSSTYFSRLRTGFYCKTILSIYLSFSLLHSFSHRNYLFIQKLRFGENARKRFFEWTKNRNCSLQPQLGTTLKRLHFRLFIQLKSLNFSLFLPFYLLCAMHNTLSNKQKVLERVFKSFLSSYYWHILFPCVKPIFN